MLEFDDLMLDFAVLYSLKCRSWSGAPLDLPRNVKHLVRTDHTVSLQSTPSPYGTLFWQRVFTRHRPRASSVIFLAPGPIDTYPE